MNYTFKAPTTKELENTLTDLKMKRSDLSMRVDPDRAKALDVRIKAIKTLIRLGYKS